VTLEVVVLKSYEELERWQSAWQELLQRSDAAAPTLTPDWLLSWWQVFGDSGGRNLRVGIVLERGKLVGLAPLLSRRHWYRSLLPFRRIELVGSGEDPADEICSDYVGVLAERGKEAGVASELCRALCGGEFGAWDEIVFPAMNGQTEMPELLRDALRKAGTFATTAVTNLAPYVPLPASFEAYCAALPSSRRYMIKRSRRDFERWADGEIEVEIARTPAELERGRVILEELHAERWNGQGEDGVFASERFREFHRRVLPKLLSSGALELTWLNVRGEPVAVLYNVVYGKKVYFYQSGRKLDLPRGVRPGIVMHAQAIERSIALGRTEYDFLAGASRYKLELSLARRPIVELRAARPKAVETMRRGAELAAARVRSLRAGFRRLQDRTRVAISPIISSG